MAYYYFDSKDAIVLAFYQRAKDELPALWSDAHREAKLVPRLKALIETKFTYFGPNRGFLGALMPYAADPASPLSPFAEPSRAIREAEFAQFDRALAETKTSMPRDLAPHIAKILWFYQMGLILFWIYDRSAHQRRSHQLLDASLKVVAMLIKVSNVPLFKPARTAVLNIVAILER